ncbi:MAG: class I adenylate-forming enzyme family protein [Candidatus Omnitrophica bacterium]|nr:class I adenylate-forming enzyme family protein [Candidatus Omnitrophota bacterium]
MNIKQILSFQKKENSSKTALVFGDKDVSFKELARKSFSVSDFLISQGAVTGDKIALFMPNIPESVYVQLGIFSLNLVLVPFDFMLTQEEIIHLINHSESRFLFVSLKNGIDIEVIQEACPCLTKIVVTEELNGYDNIVDIVQMESDEDFKAEHKDSNLAAIFYTSGSTGMPKGVMLSYAHLDNPVKTIGAKTDVTGKDVFLCGGVPFSHLGGLDYILLMVHFGTTLVLLERFHPLEFIRACQDNKVTIFCIVPAMYVAILMLKVYDKFDLSALRYAVVFGAPSSPRLLDKFRQAYPNAKLLNGWGMTETAAPNTYSPEDVKKINSIGKFGYGMAAKLVDENGMAVAGNLSGELFVKGDAVMLGYYKDERLTKETITADGWLKTGDIARCDSDGNFYIVGRKKDMIKVAGEIVFAYEIEEALRGHDEIKDAAVLGVADKLRGEVPKAFISLKDGAVCDEEDIKNYLKEKIAHFKMPREFVFMDELPKNRVGKIDKVFLAGNS